MGYVKTIYNNPKQINMANLNKIENKLEELDVDIESLKNDTLISNDSSSNTPTTVKGEKGDTGAKIVSGICISETVDDGNKLTFTFTLDDKSSFNVDVVIPKDTMATSINV